MEEILKSLVKQLDNIGNSVVSGVGGFFSSVGGSVIEAFRPASETTSFSSGGSADSGDQDLKEGASRSAPAGAAAVEPSISGLSQETQLLVAGLQPKEPYPVASLSPSGTVTKDIGNFTPAAAMGTGQTNIPEPQRVLG